MGTRTAKEPGAFLAAVQPHPRYSPKPSSLTILKTPRPRKASGFVCLLIFRTSRGRRTISPIPMILETKKVSRYQNYSPSKLTFQQRRTSLPSRSSLRRSARMCHRGSSPGSHGRKAVHRTCISVAGPSGSQYQHSNRVHSFLTLYPAAYPRPGNREKNFFPTGAAALSLKMTVFRCEAEEI
jgi:hypothetical protein